MGIVIGGCVYTMVTGVGYRGVDVYDMILFRRWAWLASRGIAIFMTFSMQRLCKAILGRLSGLGGNRRACPG